MSSKSPNIFPILTINFIGVLGFSIILPFLVFLVEDFGGNGIIYGILSATYPAFQMIGGPILGKFSDIFGRVLNSQKINIKKYKNIVIVYRKKYRYMNKYIRFIVLYLIRKMFYIFV